MNLNNKVIITFCLALILAGCSQPPYSKREEHYKENFEVSVRIGHVITLQFCEIVGRFPTEDEVVEIAKKRHNQVTLKLGNKIFFPEVEDRL